MTVIELIQMLQNLGIESYPKKIYYKTGSMTWPVIDVREDILLDKDIIVIDWQMKKENE